MFPMEGAWGSSPGKGTKIPHASKCGQKKPLKRAVTPYRKSKKEVTETLFSIKVKSYPQK